MQDSRVALVTGASRGIGAATALRLGKDGYRVAIHFRQGIDEAREIQAKIPNAETFSFDLSNEENCSHLIEAVKDRFGRIDILVNNAGITVDKLLLFAKPVDLQKLFDLNVKATFLLTKFAAKSMLKARWGRIVNVSSVVGYTGNIGQSMYAATKSAITAFTKSAAQEFAKANILINTIAPGFVKTEMTDQLKENIKQQILSRIPMNRLAETQEVASAISFLVSEDASYITGSTLHVNGGMYMT